MASGRVVLQLDVSPLNVNQATFLTTRQAGYDSTGVVR